MGKIVLLQKEIQRLEENDGRYNFVFNRKWLKIQRRGLGTNGIRNTGKFGNGNSAWADFKNGFGTPTSDEYWMGLDWIHNLTKTGNWDLMFKAKWSTIHGHFKGYRGYAIYSGFKVDDEDAQYRLHVGRRTEQENMIYRTDFFLNQNGKIFRTSDRNPVPCTSRGAWWHVNSKCGKACFNCYDAVWHYDFTDSTSLFPESTEMYMRDKSQD